ncbi:hypothetical protein JCM10213v2_000236 [Rhodosporidiobolus nylandii]
MATGKSTAAHRFPAVPRPSTSSSQRTDGTAAASASTSTQDDGPAATAQAPAVDPPAAPSIAYLTDLSKVAHDFQIVLNDLPLLKAGLNLTLPLDLPFAGVWTLVVTRDNKVTTFEVQADAPLGSVGCSVYCTMALEAMDEGRRIPISKQNHTILSMPIFPSQTRSSFPLDVRAYDTSGATEKNRMYDPAKHRQYLLKLRLEAHSPFSFEPAAAIPAVMRSRSGVDEVPHPHDLCLVFPRLSGSPLRLYANRDSLARSTTYFEDLIDALPAEEEPLEEERPRKRARRGAKAEEEDGGQEGAVEEPVQVQHRDEPDSDDETDDWYAASHETEPRATPDANTSTMAFLTITNANYTTVRAVLSWLSTGFISFAPLTSACSEEEAPSFTESARLSHVLAVANAYDTDLLPASIKSVYRLASLLGLNDLVILTTSYLRGALSPSTAALELVSPLALEVDAVQQIVVDFVLANIDAAEESEAFKSVVADIKDGERPELAKVMVKLWEEQRRKAKAAGKIGRKLRSSLSFAHVKKRKVGHEAA